MKTMLFLLVLFALCYAPFWKTEYEKRWEDRRNGKPEVTAMTTGNTSPPSSGGTEAPYTPKNGIDGKALFKANCASCHYASDKRGTGPGLKGVLGRIPGGDWKYNWVRNSSKIIASGDPYAVNRFNEFNKTSMTSFPALTNEQIDEILTYVDASRDPRTF